MNELVFFLCVYAPISIWTDLGRKRTELRPDHRRPAIIPPVATRPRPRAKPPTTRPILTRRLLLVGFVIHTHHVSLFFSLHSVVSCDDDSKLYKLIIFNLVATGPSKKPDNFSNLTCRKLSSSSSWIYKLISCFDLKKIMIL